MKNKFIIAALTFLFLVPVKCYAGQNHTSFYISIGNNRYMRPPMHHHNMRPPMPPHHYYRPTFYYSNYSVPIYNTITYTYYPQPATTPVVTKTVESVVVGGY